MKRPSLRLFLLMCFLIPAQASWGQFGLFGPPRVETRLNPGTELGIVRKPPISLPMATFRGKMRTLPTPDPNATNPAFQVDFRGQTLTEFDLKDKADLLGLADFDSQTRWPDAANMPDGFHPDAILDVSKNPGLGVRKLHVQGITGKGVGIAIIDQTLLIEHEEYKDRVKTYEEIHSPQSSAQMHAPAVASIAVGKTCGVAPEADLYFIAEQHANFQNGQMEFDVNPLAEAIDRVVAINASLPVGRKIRVISISFGWTPNLKGYEVCVKAVDRAKAAGILVLSTEMEQTYPDRPSFLLGLGRSPKADPDQASSYSLGSWWGKLLAKPDSPFRNYLMEKGKRGIVLVPMDSRTTASPTGVHDYVFYRNGGLSWSVPYLAGVYALACQVMPEITPKDFLTAAHKTGDQMKLTEHDESDAISAMIVNPVRLIESLKAKP